MVRQIDELMKKLGDDAETPRRSMPDNDLYGPEPAPCIDAAAELARMGIVAAVPGLIRLLDSGNCQARVAAVRALGILGASERKHETEKRVICLWRDEKMPWVRTEALRVLLTWGVRPPGLIDMDEFAQALQRDRNDPWMIGAHLKRLADHRAEELLPACPALVAALGGLLRDADAGCAEPALRMLASVGLGNPRDFLDLHRPEAREERKLGGVLPTSALQEAAVAAYKALKDLQLPWKDEEPVLVPLLQHSDGFTRQLIAKRLDEMWWKPEAREALKIHQPADSEA